jgi:hypothetical protein
MISLVTDLNVTGCLQALEGGLYSPMVVAPHTLVLRRCDPRLNAPWPMTTDAEASASGAALFAREPPPTLKVLV